jgi:hypothetical protein
VNEVKFVKGLFANKPHERAPDFIVCELSIKADELVGFLNDQDGEWINLQIKVPQKTNPDKPRRLTVAINDWKPEREPTSGRSRKDVTGGNQRKPAKKDDFDDDLPF